MFDTYDVLNATIRRVDLPFFHPKQRDLYYCPKEIMNIS